MKLAELTDKLKIDATAVQKCENPEADLRTIRVFSPLEKEWQESTLYLAVEDCYAVSEKPADGSISVLFLGADAAQFDWADNLIVLSRINEEWGRIEQIQHLFCTDELQVLRQIETLTNIVIKDSGMQYVLDQMSDIMGNPLILLDTNLQMHQMSIRAFAQEWRERGLTTTEIAGQADMMIRGLSEIISEQYQYMANEETESFVFYSPKEAYNFAVFKIGIHHVDIAILVVPEKEHNLLETDIRVMNAVQGLLAQELQKASYIMGNHESANTNFLIELLEMPYPNQNIVNHKLELLASPLKEEKYIVVVRFLKKHEQNVNLLLFQFRRILTGQLYAIHKNELVILMHRDKNSGLGEYTIQTLREIGNKCYLEIGISRNFSDIVEVHKYYQQATRALDYGDVYQVRSEKHPLYFFSDYVLIELMESYRKRGDLMELCNSKLLKLLEYDREHDTDYMTVLNEFMENSMNVTQTAEVLFIHRNTLIYRIEKIKSIMGTTLEDSWENFTLRLSMWILLFLREYDPKWRKEMEKAYWAKRD